MMRNICSMEIKEWSKIAKLGGPGKVVEIDESLVTKVKYNKGSKLKKVQILMFGILERDKDGKLYVELVSNSTSETLLKIIVDHEKEGTMIVSDSWSGYNRLKDLKFGHMTVNHKYHFLDPVSGAHTNKIEGMWKHAKDNFKQINGCQRIYLNSFLDEFMWRNIVTHNRVDAFNKIIDAIEKYYPADSTKVELEKIFMMQS